MLAISARRNLPRCWDSGDWLRLTMSYSISDTDFSLPSASCVSICNRRLFPTALRVTVIFGPFFVGSEGLGIGSPIC